MLSSHSVRSLKLFLDLARSSRKRHLTEDTYLEFQKNQGQLVYQYLARRGVDLRGKVVADIACGDGGYSLVFQQAGANAIAIDRFADRIHPEVQGRLPVMVADGISLPFKDGCVDFLFCASLIEHVDEPMALLHELHRVLSPEGICYLSFPPFYSPVGGHQFKPFHLLGEKAALRILGWLRKTDNVHANGFASAYGQWGLYPRTIGSVKGMIGQADFVIQEQSTRYLPINFSKIPIVSEFLTWHVQYLLRRRQ